MRKETHFKKAVFSVRTLTCQQTEAVEGHAETMYSVASTSLKIKL